MENQLGTTVKSDMCCRGAMAFYHALANILWYLLLCTYIVSWRSKLEWKKYGQSTDEDSKLKASHGLLYDLLCSCIGVLWSQKLPAHFDTFRDPT
jgi:hypothetical protein